MEILSSVNLNANFTSQSRQTRFIIEHIIKVSWIDQLSKLILGTCSIFDRSVQFDIARVVIKRIRVPRRIDRPVESLNDGILLNKTS